MTNFFQKKYDNKNLFNISFGDAPTTHQITLKNKSDTKPFYEPYTKTLIDPASEINIQIVGDASLRLFKSNIEQINKLQDQAYLSYEAYLPTDTKVTANSIAVTGISLSAKTKTLVIGKKFQVTVTLEPSNATDQSVIYSSDNTDIATIDQNGLITAIKEGKANITAKSVNSGLDANTVLTVKVPDTTSSATTEESTTTPQV